MSKTVYAAIGMFLLMVLSFTAPISGMEKMEEPKFADTGGDDPSVTLIRPTGGEEYNVGEVFDILFSNSDLSGDIILELTTDGSAFSPIATKTVSPSTSSWHEWTVPDSPTTTAQVRISSVDDPTITDISDHFTILGPCSNVTGNVIQWDSTVAASPGYASGTPVEYTLMSGNVWVSLVDNNGNTPGPGDTWVQCTCEELANGEVWASSMGYGVGQVVAHNGMFWISAFSPNNGNEPGVVYDAWRPCMDENVDACESANGLAGPWYDDSVLYYSLGDVVEYPANSGNYYVSTRNYNSAHPNMGELRGWTPCSCRDLWDGTTYAPGTTYSAYQIVYNDGEFYVRKAVNIVLLGGDPEPGGTWSKVWRLCMPSTCKDRSIGVWNTVDRDALLYDTEVVVQDNSLFATYWISLRDDNQDLPGGDTWRICNDPDPTYEDWWDAKPGVDPPGWGEVVLQEMVIYRSARITIADTSGSDDTAGRYFNVVIGGKMYQCTFKDSSVDPPTYSNCEEFGAAATAPGTGSGVYISWTDGTHTDGEEAPPGALLNFPDTTCAELEGDSGSSNQFTCEDIVAVGPEPTGGQSTFTEGGVNYISTFSGEHMDMTNWPNGCWVEGSNGDVAWIPPEIYLETEDSHFLVEDSIHYEESCPNENSEVTTAKDVPPILVSPCIRGDPNTDGAVDISDPTNTLNYDEILCGAQLRYDVFESAEGTSGSDTSGRTIYYTYCHAGCCGVRSEDRLTAHQSYYKKCTGGMMKPTIDWDETSAVVSTNTFTGLSEENRLVGEEGDTWVEAVVTTFTGVTCADMGLDSGICEDVLMITNPGDEPTETAYFNPDSYLQGGMDECWFSNNACSIDVESGEELTVSVHVKNPSTDSAYVPIEYGFTEGINVDHSGDIGPSEMIYLKNVVVIVSDSTGTDSTGTLDHYELDIPGIWEWDNAGGGARETPPHYLNDAWFDVPMMDGPGSPIDHIIIGSMAGGYGSGGVQAGPGVSVVNFHISVADDAEDGEQSQVVIRMNTGACVNEEDACSGLLVINLNIKDDVENPVKVITIAGKEVAQKDVTIVGGTAVGTSVLWLIGRRLLGSPA